MVKKSTCCVTKQSFTQSKSGCYRVESGCRVGVTERGGARVGACLVVAGASSACGSLYCLVFLVSRSALGSWLLPNVTRQFFLFTLYIYLQEKHSSDVARRAVLPSVRRYSLSQVKCRIRSCAILRGSAHSSLSLDVGVAATPIPHSNPISLYTAVGQPHNV